MRTIKELKTLLTLLTPALVLIGCDDARSVRLAQEGADRQAQQNNTMAELQREVAAGSRSLVEEQGAARREALQLQQSVQGERDDLSAGWNDLEGERRRMAASRRADSLLAAVIRGSAAAAAAIVALAFAYLTIIGLGRDNESTVLSCEFLADEVLPRLPKFLPGSFESDAKLTWLETAGALPLPGPATPSDEGTGPRKGSY